MLIRLRMRGRVIGVCFVSEGELVGCVRELVACWQAGRTKIVTLGGASMRNGSDEFLPLFYEAGPPTWGTPTRTARCGYCKARDGTVTRTPGNGRSIAHGFLVIGAGRVSGEMRRGFTTEITEDTERGGR